MGMFDSVYANCPKCGKLVEFQSKEGECCLERYSVDTAPLPVLLDVINAPHLCGHCKTWFALIDPRYPPHGDIPKPIPAARVVRTPGPEEVWIYHDGSFGNWNVPFSFADLLEPSESIEPAQSSQPAALSNPNPQEMGNE